MMVISLLIKKFSQYFFLINSVLLFCSRSGSDSAAPTGLSIGDADICPVGHYCPAQTQEPKPCPAGSFNNKTGLVAEVECQPCLPGYYCDVPGLAYPSGLCKAGYYCALGSNSSSPTTLTASGGPCPAGSFCLMGSSQAQPCPAGYYNSLTQQYNCTICPAGYYCLSGSTNITLCPKG